MLEFVFFPFMFLFVVPFLLFFIIFWVWMLVDCIKSDLEISDKLIWVLIIAFFNFIGALLYLIFVKLNKNYKGFGVKMQTSKKIRRLYRSKRNRVIAGVCGGIAEYFEVDPVIIRLLWVFLTLASMGGGILAYIIAWIIVPEEPSLKQKS